MASRTYFIYYVTGSGKAASYKGKLFRKSNCLFWIEGFNLTSRFNLSVTFSFFTFSVLSSFVCFFDGVWRLSETSYIFCLLCGFYWLKLTIFRSHVSLSFLFVVHLFLFLIINLFLIQSLFRISTMIVSPFILSFFISRGVLSVFCFLLY